MPNKSGLTTENLSTEQSAALTSFIKAAREMAPSLNDSPLNSPEWQTLLTRFLSDQKYKREYTDGLNTASAEITRNRVNYEQILLVLGLFVIDPPDTPYQRGYMQAFKQAAEELKTVRVPRSRTNHE